MKNFVSGIDRVTVDSFWLNIPAITAGRDAVSGDLCALPGNIIGVLAHGVPQDAQSDIGFPVSVITSGVFVLPGSTGIDIDGSAVYLDDSTGLLTPNPASGIFVGYPYWYEDSGGVRYLTVPLGLGVPPASAP